MEPLEKLEILHERLINGEGGAKELYSLFDYMNTPDEEYAKLLIRKYLLENEKYILYREAKMAAIHLKMYNTLNQAETKIKKQARHMFLRLIGVIMTMISLLLLYILWDLLLISA